VEKAIKEMRNKKTTGDDDDPVTVIKLLGKGGIELMLLLINNILYRVNRMPGTPVSL
jgi:hypothetical protein